MNMMSGALYGVVTIYQLTIRPLIGSHCRFEPSCSQYALKAFAEHGAGRGSFFTVGRLLRCNPWNPGGVDPVPPSRINQ